MVTEMLIEPSTTWLLVSTSPVDVTIMPVPAAAPVPVLVWTTVLMSTIAGATLAVTCVRLSVPFWFAEGVAATIGALELAGWLVCGWVAVCATCAAGCRYRAIVRPMPRPPPAARIVATMVTTAIQRPQGSRCGAGGMYGGGGYQPVGCGVRSLEWGSIWDIWSLHFALDRLPTHDAAELFEEYQEILRV